MKYYTRSEIEEVTGDDAASLGIVARLETHLNADRFHCTANHNRFCDYYTVIVLILSSDAFPCHIEVELTNELKLKGIHPHIHDRSRVYPPQYAAGIVQAMAALAEATRIIVEEFA